MVDYRHRVSKEVRSFPANSPEGRELAKDPEWDKCPPSETEAVAVPAGDPATTTPPSAA